MSSNFCQLSELANIQGGFAFKGADFQDAGVVVVKICLLYTSPSPRDRTRSRMPSSA